MCNVVTKITATNTMSLYLWDRSDPKTYFL